MKEPQEHTEARLGDACCAPKAPITRKTSAETSQEDLLEVCQKHRAEDQTPVLSSHFVSWERLRWSISVDGPFATARRLISYFMRKCFDRKSCAPNAEETSETNDRTFSNEYPVLDLQPGELVRVRSEYEIQKTLDHDGRNHGLKFMAEMRPYCGRQMRVMKRVRLIVIDEFAIVPQLKRLKNTVLLEGAICPGTGIRCDRCCYFFWREAWLRRVPSAEVEETD